MATKTIAAWFDSNPEATTVVKTWLTEKTAHRTTWSIDTLQGVLRKEFKMPFKNPAAFARYLRKAYGQRYLDAVA